MGFCTFAGMQTPSDPTPNFTTWLKAARLRTLPLAFSCILLGSFLAGSQGKFSLSITILCLLTTLFYQVLSNFSNDLGDGLKGTDSDRKGEARAVASGKISIPQMKSAVRVFALLSFFTGTLLSYKGTEQLHWGYTLFFILLGVVAIWSAISYTMGDKAYGYAGLGDLFVLLFFGLVGVFGSYFLQAQVLDWIILLPSFAVGFLAVGVLNLNNTRDIGTDIIHGKMSIPARLGRKGAKRYHLVLMIASMVCALWFTLYNPTDFWGYLWILSLPAIFKNTSLLFRTNEPEEIDKLLKPLALTTLLFSLLLGVGTWLNNFSL